MSNSNNTNKVTPQDSILVRFERELHNESHFFVPWLEKAEAATRVKRIYLAYGFLVLLALYLIIGHAAQLVCNILGFIYPAYRSLKALETSSKDDDTKWLIYWVTFAAFSVFEFFPDLILDWFPPYFLAKLVFLVWCSLPIEKNGSYVMYNKVIRPVFLQNQLKVDEVVGNVVNKFSGFAASGYEEVKKFTSKDKDN